MKWLLVYVLSQSLFVLYDNLYIRTYKQDSVVLNDTTIFDGYSDIAVGLIDEDILLDTVYWTIESKKSYEVNDDILECFKQVENISLLLKLSTKNSILTFSDKEVFEYPYSGFSFISFSINNEGYLIKHCKSSRHSDKIYVDHFYKFDNKLDKLKKEKEIIKEGDGINFIVTENNQQKGFLYPSYLK